MRVVITGYGVYSCIGKNVGEVTSSLREGKSGIGLDLARREFGYRSCLTGIVTEPDLKADLPRRARLGMSEEAKYAYVSTKEALNMAGISQEYLDANRAGILFGNDSTAGAVVEAVDTIRAKKDTMLVGSGSIFQSMNSTVNMNLATIFKLRGINFTISAACASGSHAIGVGYHLIKSGLEDMIICGGAQEVNMYAFGSFDGLGVFSTREEDPAKSSRPFDQGRDGLVTSGGAATVVIESLESAQRRGATILGEVTGYGFSSNGDHISNPDTAGQVDSISRALKMAEVKPEQIDYVNAHATSTPKGDMFEAQAIFDVFGGKTPVSSTKSMTGHECWMAGASEIVYSMIMMKNGFIAPNINFENPDEVSRNLNIIAESKNAELNMIASNSFGFGGTNSTLIIKKYE
ncbi:beta-ketoacyl-[acyl-carrier-protein] synthase family protein [Gilvimarinus agarilyticus]|uniref:beta-ketoacyl-[acyl-carrier-protein] synthase family protein n=1 Tax=Reichenbachiella agariperforans TaxID=156994 RepID=UPI001C088883|nr:beta-ketoacyl-[acyl-carrier-protein] synthase family protein [Reichenbachiella agariperforans]MBU2884845.1 beta-ketoacyl-[acyl-carrier-protein] synthase family protein [Gilvimarinus agarilyticus]MBU2913015.1 beta-ketoacyl-[acyl-carrier-protein] synthase family protein [Reichenbachiella agariperforans]